MSTVCDSAISVSIVEDDAPVRNILVGWIAQAEGFRCVSNYGIPREVLLNLPREKPDVVLMDINLPDMNGIECVRQLKPVLPQSQFVMLTVYEDADHIFEALSGGATGYLLKQTERHELLAALKDVHAGGSPMSSSIARKVVQSFRSFKPGLPPEEDLSPRQLEILELLARGYLYKEVGETLKISTTTVNTYIRRIYEKLQVRSRGQAVAKYMRM